MDLFVTRYGGRISGEAKILVLYIDGPLSGPDGAKADEALIAIRGKSITVASVGSVLLGDADTQLVGKLAIESQQNQAQLKTATTVRQQAEDDWKSTSAVNVDEEGISLIEFQNMYQANMKVISVANNLFDATLQMFN